MAIYSESKTFYRRGSNSIWLEDEELATPKHEVSVAAYEIFTTEIFEGSKPVCHSDGSFTYYTQTNCDSYSETTFWIENN